MSAALLSKTNVEVEYVSAPLDVQPGMEEFKSIFEKFAKPEELAGGVLPVSSGIDHDNDAGEQIALLKGTLGTCLLQHSAVQQSVAGLTKSVSSMQQDLAKLVAHEVVDLSPEITKAHLEPGETPQCRCKRLRR